MLKKRKLGGNSFGSPSAKVASKSPSLSCVVRGEVTFLGQIPEAETDRLHVLSWVGIARADEAFVTYVQC